MLVVSLSWRLMCNVQKNFRINTQDWIKERKMGKNNHLISFGEETVSITGAFFLFLKQWATLLALVFCGSILLAGCTNNPNANQNELVDAKEIIFETDVTQLTATNMGVPVNSEEGETPWLQEVLAATRHDDPTRPPRMPLRGG